MRTQSVDAGYPITRLFLQQSNLAPFMVYRGHIQAVLNCKFARHHVEQAKIVALAWKRDTLAYLISMDTFCLRTISSMNTPVHTRLLRRHLLPGLQ